MGSDIDGACGQLVIESQKVKSCKEVDLEDLVKKVKNATKVIKKEKRIIVNGIDSRFIAVSSVLVLILLLIMRNL